MANDRHRARRPVGRRSPVYPSRGRGQGTVSAHGTGLARKSVSGQLRGYVKAVNAFLARNKVVCPVTGIIAINSNAWIEIAAPPPYPLVPYDRLKAQIEAMPEARRASENEKAREALCSVTRGA